MHSPIFVVGAMRSGSTLLRLILDAHPHIAISEETAFMGAVAATKAIPNWRYGREWYGRLGWDEPELDARLREFYSGMFERFAAAQGKQRWGEKTPLHSRHIGEMSRIFPDAVFVGIVRHPGAAVASLRRNFKFGVADAAAYWEGLNAEMLRAGAALGDDRFALVRYEDLVRHPEPTLREMMDWLGEPWSDDLLRHNEVQTAKGAPRLVDGRTSTREPIRAERADRWLESMSTADRATVLAQTAPLARFLGYDPSGALEPAPIVAPGPTARRMVLTGHGLAQRLQEPQHAVPLDARPEMLVAEELGADELLRRLQQAEYSLARIRSRRTVRFVEAVRLWERRLTIPPQLRRLGRRTDRRSEA